MSETTDESEIRRIAREEARKVSGLKVEDPDGEEWSLDQLMERFQIERRTALKTIGLIAVGYHAPRAVLSAISKPAAAAADDNLTVPGTLDAGAITTDVLTIKDSGIESAGTLSAGSSTRITVSFSHDFSTEPVVLVNPGATDLLNAEIYHIAESVTTNSFDIRIESGSSSDQTIDHISWVALKSP